MTETTDITGDLERVKLWVITCMDHHDDPEIQIEILNTIAVTTEAMICELDPNYPESFFTEM